MLNLLSIVAGLIAAIFMVLGLVPLLGWVNWIMLPIAGVGLLLGLISRGTAGRNLNIIVLVIGMIRLWIGGGIF